MYSFEASLLTNNSAHPEHGAEQENKLAAQQEKGAPFHYPIKSSQTQVIFEPLDKKKKKEIKKYIYMEMIELRRNS